jgi:hypothetical protein
MKFFYNKIYFPLAIHINVEKLSLLRSFSVSNMSVISELLEKVIFPACQGQIILILHIQDMRIYSIDCYYKEQSASNQNFILNIVFILLLLYASSSITYCEITLKQNKSIKIRK